jgi:formylglycine-generating enzyme
MKTTGKIYFILFALLMLFSCKTPKSQEHHYVDYQPYFDQTLKEFITTPSLKDARLDTLVQVLSNLRDEPYDFKDTLSIVQEFELNQGELIINVDLINEKLPIFDTFMVVKGFLMKDTRVNLLFPVISGSFKQELLSMADSMLNRQPTDSVTVQSTIPDTSAIMQTALQPGSLKDTIAAIEKTYYTREEILADTTRDLLDADATISNEFASTGWKIGDSIPYYQGFSNFVPDSSIMLKTEMVYVEIHDKAREVKQYPFEKLSQEVINKKTVTDKIIISDQVVFKHFYKDEEDIFMKMIKVQGGDFKIGSNEFDEDERPEHGLSVSNFLLGKYEVTNNVFCSFLNLLKCDSLGKVNRTRFIDTKSKYSKIFWDSYTRRYKVFSGYEKYPAINITWAGANKICKMMGGRLPSEAEWEYAAKGGAYAIRYYINENKSDFSYEHRFAGSNLMGEVGWFVDNSDGFCQMVGTLEPNRLGLFDMCGNVWEWCYDNYDKEYYQHNGDSHDPICLNGTGMRVNRGGSWSSDAMYCRITNRNFLDEFQCNPYLGFRLMKEWKK